MKQDLLKHWIVLFLSSCFLFANTAAAQDTLYAVSVPHSALASNSIVNLNGPRLSFDTPYQRPYSFDDSQINKPVLARNTFLLVGAGVATMGILYLMPSSVTNWEDDDKSPAKKWWDNVTHGPVWDEDDLWLNYVAHPYVGAIYYMGARSAGANAMESFAYSFMLSTFFWEYGIESFAEIPSIQDLIVTPVAGAVLGEGFYMAKRHIIENDYQLWESEFLGKGAIFLMDPITEVADWLVEDKDSTVAQSLSVQSYPSYSTARGAGYRVSVQFAF